MNLSFIGFQVILILIGLFFYNIKGQDPKDERGWKLFGSFFFIVSNLSLVYLVYYIKIEYHFIKKYKNQQYDLSS